MAMDTAMEIFVRSKSFPMEERYSMTDQIRRSSRSVCANVAEAWRKRRYPKSFVSKLSDAEAEAAETQVWIELAYRCKYLSENQAKTLGLQYENIQGKIVNMVKQPEKWSIK